MTLALLLLGIALLLAGGAALVRGASGLAAQLGISPMLIGLTVVAFGTSAPELVVTTVGSLSGNTALAFGNVIGSNLANLGLVLGISALIAPIAMQGELIRREVPILLLASAVLAVLCADPLLRGTAPIIDRSDAAILLILFSGFVYVSILAARQGAVDSVARGVEQLPIPDVPPTQHNWPFVAAGVVGLAVGGELTVTNGGELAEMLGVSPTLVGLFVVAIGTSLPELACSAIAAVKREPDLCVGNVVGSNLFNALLVLPTGAVLSGIPVPNGGNIDVLLSLGLAAALIPIFVLGRSRLGRPAGSLLLLVYLGYLVLRFAAV